MKYNNNNEMMNRKPFTFRELVLIASALFIILLTRLPWISAGYGRDPDSFSVAETAHELVKTGQYSYSRPPGYPVYEYLMALTIKSGPIISNGITVIFSCIAFLFFALILRYFGIIHYLLLASAFALTPIIYINSTCTIDYVLAMALILGSTYFTVSRYYIVAGICLGLAIGCRITSGAFLLPLVLWIWLDNKKLSSLYSTLKFIAASLLVGFICFLPVICRYGIGFFTFADIKIYPSFYSLFRTGLLEVWGGWGLITFVVFIVIGCLSSAVIKSVRESFKKPYIQKALIMSSMVVILYIFAFLRLPLEAAYLIPVVPFSFLIVGLITPPDFLKYFAIAFLLSSFISISPGGIKFVGPIMQDNSYRLSRIKETEKIIESVGQLSESAIIVVGWKLPQISLEINNKKQFNQHFIYAIDASNYKLFVEQGRKIYFLPGMDDFNFNFNGTDLVKLGAQKLKVPN